MLTGKLTANAYTNVYDKNVVTKLSSTTWTDGGNGAYVYRNVPLVGSDDDPAIMPVSVNFVGTGANDAALEYAVVISTWQNAQVQVTDYLPSNTPFNVTLPYETFHNGIAYRCTLYVRRVDDGRIYNDQVYNSTFTWRCQVSEDVEENTLPDDWVQNTTNTIAEKFVPLETVTTPIDTDNVDDSVDEFKEFLEGVQEHETLATVFMGYVSELLRLKGVTAFLCFAICCCTMIAVFELSGG